MLERFMTNFCLGSATVLSVTVVVLGADMLGAVGSVGVVVVLVVVLALLASLAFCLFAVFLGCQPKEICLPKC